MPEVDTLPALLKAPIELTPEAVALHIPGGAPLRFMQLQEHLDRVAAALDRAGLGRDDRVALALPAGAATAVACLGVMARAVCAPLNPAYTHAEFTDYLTALRATALLATPDAHAAQTAARALGLRVLELHAGPRENGCLFRIAVHDAAAGGADARAASAQDVALVLHTSGSTSRPKIVPLTHANLCASARNLARSLHLTAADRCLNMMPMFHVGALVDLLIAPLSVGGSVVCATELSTRAFFAALRELQPTWHQGVPTMLHDIAAHAAPPGPHNLRFIRAVSAALPRRVLDAIEQRFGVPVVEIYGMTETAGLITSNPLPPGTRKPGSVGLPAGPEVRIVDEAGNPARVGQRGEVIVRGATVMTGYERDGMPDRSAFIGDWLRTGDEGTLDADGYLFLTGRLKEMINRGGEKIAPREIDEVALRLPRVADAAAFSVAHESLGEEVALAVVVEPGAQVGAQEIIAACARELAYFKVPRAVHFMDALPRTAGGKLTRHVLTAQFGAGDTARTPPAWRAPDTPLAQRLAPLWARALGVPRVGLDDNFFDLGGDSLKAFTLLHELEQELGHGVNVAALFDAPTLAGFEQHLLRGGVTGAHDAGTGLPDPLRAELARYMAGWQGARARPEALIVGHNTLGTRPPLFWAVNSYEQFAALARHLGADQPIYGLRSLMQTSDKSPEALRALARHYLHELLDLQPHGPYLLGGYCEGGRVAFELARLLSDAGREVRLLALHDRFVPDDYAGRVAFFCSADGRYNPFHYFHQPELGWAKYYCGAMALYRHDAIHKFNYLEPHVAVFAAQLRAEIDSALHGTPSPARIEPARCERLNPADCRAELDTTLPLWLEPGEQRTLHVRITNRGNTVWKATARSGIKLANRWRNPFGKLRRGIDGSAALEQDLAPGASMTVALRITAPRKSGLRMVDLDLIDDGLAWFQDRGSSPLHLRVIVVRGARFVRKRPVAAR